MRGVYAVLDDGILALRTKLHVEMMRVSAGVCLSSTSTEPMFLREISRAPTFTTGDIGSVGERTRDHKTLSFLCLRVQLRLLTIHAQPASAAGTRTLAWLYYSKHEREPVAESQTPSGRAYLFYPIYIFMFGARKH